MKGLVLGGTASGVGKTVATLAVLRAFEAAGYDPQPAKAGPDFIDPTHHETVVDKPSRTLDPWLEGTAGMRRTYWRGDGDVCVVEGVMGLYDGSKASTASVAAGLDLPVVLVVDAAAGMESVAATALGFREYATRAGVNIDVCGIVAQRAHGGRHAEGIRDALPDDLAYFGRIPPLSDLEIPDRHLGLQMGDEAALSPESLSAASEHLDVAALAEVAREPPTAPIEPGEQSGRTVAVARDEAFCFVYPTTLEYLRERGTVRTFSPVAGDPVPDSDAVYLPGGYPELHAESLSASSTLGDLREIASEGRPVYGECGGLMALAERLTTADGTAHEMAGVLPAEVRMCDRYQALDHVELEARTGGPVGTAGTRYRGHEFHYSTAEVATDATFAFDVVRGDGIDGTHDGLTAYRTVGTYCHCHAESGVLDTLLSG